MTTTSPLPAGLPGFAVSPINERIDAVNGDDDRLWVRHPGKRVFRPLGAPELWRFKPAHYRHHGWWCDAPHLRCADCLDAELTAEINLQAAPDIDWSDVDAFSDELTGGDAA